MQTARKPFLLLRCRSIQLTRPIPRPVSFPVAFSVMLVYEKGTKQNENVLISAPFKMKGWRDGKRNIGVQVGVCVIYWQPFGQTVYSPVSGRVVHAMKSNTVSEMRDPVTLSDQEIAC